MPCMTSIVAQGWRNVSLLSFELASRSQGGQRKGKDQDHGDQEFVHGAFLAEPRHERLWYCDQRQAWSTAAQVDGIVSRLVASGGCSQLYRLLTVSLPDEFRPGHVDGTVDGPRLGARVVLEDFHHQCGVFGEDHAGLQACARRPTCRLVSAESSGGIDRHVSVETLANSGGSPLVNLISQ